MITCSCDSQENALPYHVNQEGYFIVSAGNGDNLSEAIPNSPDLNFLYQEQGGAEKTKYNMQGGTMELKLNPTRPLS